MVRTQIQLDEGVYEQIRNLAHRKRISIAETVRCLVGIGLREGLDDEGAGPSADALLGLAGVGRSGLGDLGRRHDDYLIEDVDQ